MIDFYLICWKQMTEEEKYFEWSLWEAQMYHMDYSQWCDNIDAFAAEI